MIQVLTSGRALETERLPNRPTGELWLSAADLGKATGWQLSGDTRQSGRQVRYDHEL